MMVNKIEFSVPFCDIILERDLNSRHIYADPNFVGVWQGKKKYAPSPRKTIEIKCSTGYKNIKKWWLPAWVKPLSINFNLKTVNRVSLPTDIELKEFTTIKTRKTKMYAKPKIYDKNDIKKAYVALYGKSGEFNPSKWWKFKYDNFCLREVLDVPGRRKFARIYGKKIAHKTYFLTKKAFDFFNNIAFRRNPGLKSQLRPLLDYSSAFTYVLKTKYSPYVSEYFTGIFYNKNIKKFYRASKKERLTEIRKKIDYLEEILLDLELQKLANKHERKAMKNKKNITPIPTKFFTPIKKQQPKKMATPSAPELKNTQELENPNPNMIINNYNMTVNICPIM